MEWLNNDSKSPYKGKILHTYNYQEIQIGRYYIDGWATLENEFIDAEKTKKRKVLFEYRGCYFHCCPYCKKKPLSGTRSRKKINGTWTTIQITPQELDERENKRMHYITDLIREKDGVYSGEPGFASGHYYDDNMDSVTPIHYAEKLPCFGPINFNHRIEIMYGCVWLKKWKQLEKLGRGPRSYDYPFLFRGTPAIQSGFYKYNAGVTEDCFKTFLASRDRKGRSRFCGFAMVNLRTPQHVREKMKHVPPIFTKKKLSPENCQGKMRDILSQEEIDHLYPSEENIFCYDADRYLCTAPMLEELSDIGVEYELLYFVMYHSDTPFKTFVEKMRDERIACMMGDNPDKTGAEVCKIISNSWIGRLAMNKSRFTHTSVVGVDKLWKKMRTPRFKSSTNLRTEDSIADPLYEVTSSKAKIKEDLPIHIQVLVYQNSKLHFFKFLRTIYKYLREGSFEFCYCDTDSIMLALTDTDIKYCVKKELLSEWNDLIVPKWFADEKDERSKKEPGLLKIEAQINSGWFIALSPKCYIMCTAPPSDLERKIIEKQNRQRGLQVIAEFLANMEEPAAKIEKKSSKGVNRNIYIRFCKI